MTWLQKLCCPDALIKEGGRKESGRGERKDKGTWKEGKGVRENIVGIKKEGESKEMLNLGIQDKGKKQWKELRKITLERR